MEHWQKLGADVFTVEAQLGGQYQLQGDRLLQYPLAADATFWHKEALINAGVKQLPAIYDAVVWADADLLPVDDADWLGKLARLLDDYPVVQAWSELQSLDRRGKREPVGHNRQWRYLSLVYVNQQRGSYSRRTVRTQDGAPGGIWAARREVLDRCNGLYDRAIAGGGDTIFLYAAYGTYNFSAMSQFTEVMAADVREWGEGLTAATEGRVGCLLATIEHLWHGDYRHRQYTTRYQGLKRAGYDPRRDIVMDDLGMLAWSSVASPLMRGSVYQYMHSRHEK
jgi:hypothetical protein